MFNLSNLLKLILFLFVVTCKGEDKTQEVKIIKQVFDHDIRQVVNFKPSKEGFWEDPPDIILCKAAPYSTRRVEKAISFWKNLNHKLGDVKVTDQFNACIDENQKFMRSHIIIKLRGQKFDESKYAVTTTYKIAKTDMIIAAVIQLQNFSTDIDWVLEHEIGHALGWKHHNLPGHLMNYKAELGGWSTKGLKLTKR